MVFKTFVVVFFENNAFSEAAKTVVEDSATSFISLKEKYPSQDDLFCA
jgi:hypothetical protein